MSKDRFNYILQKVFKHLKGNITSPKEKLVITLKYLATGEAFVDLATRFRMGVTSVRKYIMETVIAIIKEVTPIALPKLKKEDWINNSNEFFQRWNFPHCLGATDGKHVDMFCPPKSGSENFNYKKRFSINLQGVVDPRYKFIMTDVGAAGSNHDATVFWHSDFGKMWYNQDKRLDLPEPTPLPNTQHYVPYQLIGDDAYGQSTTVLTPFSGRNLTIMQRCFNYRLSRARRIVENAFGILTQTWRILLKRIQVHRKFAIKIVRACVALHNFLRMSKSQLETNLSDQEESMVIDTIETMSDAVNAAASLATNRSTKEAIEMRNKFAHWCVNEGDVNFQYEMI